MKKIFALLALSLATVSAKAALFINNNASYDVVIVLWAHDSNHPAPCSYYCQRFNVPSGTSMAFNNVTSGGLLWGQPWNIPATLVTGGSGFDAADIVPSTSLLPYNTIGNPGSCAATTSYSAAASGYSINASWLPLGGNNVMLDITN